MKCGGEPTRRERLQELRLAQNLLAGNRRSLILFDEMEDLLASPLGGIRFFRPKRSAGIAGDASMVFMHRLLENSPVPVLWTMNDAHEVSRAILRRMMFALELRLPTAPVRARVWSRQLRPPRYHGGGGRGSGACRGIRCSSRASLPA